MESFISENVINDALQAACESLEGALKRDLHVRLMKVAEAEINDIIKDIVGKTSVRIEQMFLDYKNERLVNIDWTINGKPGG